MAEAKRYTEQEKADAIVLLIENGNNQRKTSEQTGIPRRTIRWWWDSLDDAKRREYMDLAKARQEPYWQKVHDMCLEQAEARISEMSARDALVGAGIAFDKLRLLRGEATDITGTISADAASLAKEIDGILGQVEVPEPAPADGV
jgi:transposase-like protein